MLVILLLGGAAWASPLELSLDGGPATASLDDLNTSILVFNSLIEHLNATLAAIPGVTGAVAALPPMISGVSFRAAERYWVDDWIAFTGSFGYYRTSTATRGQYVGSETSTIDVSAALSTISVLAGVRVQFLDVGLRLAADAAAGYYYATLDHAVTFEIPSEYPDVIAGVPPEGAGRDAGGAFGAEVGLSIAYPLFDSFSVEALVAYRWITIPALRHGAVPLDLDGNGAPEAATLDGLSVQIGFALAIDLSLDGEKGE